jgi:hypothetical protein
VSKSFKALQQTLDSGTQNIIKELLRTVQQPETPQPRVAR